MKRSVEMSIAAVAGLLLAAVAATGPGSLKTRNALSPAGQKGFDAAVAFHLARNYKR